MNKNILGLDLGTTSCGFAHIIESKNQSESKIIKVGVRVNPLTTDEQTNFEKGKAVSVNADRTLKRSARRNLDRYQDRRKNLIEVLTKSNIIKDDTILTEDGKNTTHSTYALRAKSANEKVVKNELARIFLAINKKRGYKSSRKAKNKDEGQIIDGMAIAKRLYEEELTPGQLSYSILKSGKKNLPDYYRSDLKSELDKVWNKQKEFYPEIFTNELFKEVDGKGQRATSAIFWTRYELNKPENKGSKEQQKLKIYEWRSKAVKERLSKEEAVFIITEINSNLNNSSGYLGAISDRSKELYFNKQTVGQYLYEQLKNNFHTSLKNKVFYRQDYLDEFETIWETQSKYHSELTDALKIEIRDIIIFYQRKLKSQKGLVSFCEFESKEIEVIKNNKITTRRIGSKVAPKSSQLFQEFKIWQNLNNVLIKKKGSKKRVSKDIIKNIQHDNEQEIFSLDLAAKQLLFEELNIKGNLKSDKIIEILGYKPSEWELNYSEIEGNRTNKSLYNAYLKILEIEGYDEDLLKLQGKDNIDVSEINGNAAKIKNMIKQIFETLNINTKILEFNAELNGKAFEQQASYQLWHLLYSYEEDNSASGNEKLYNLLKQKFGFQTEHAKILANITFSDDYGNLSAKAMKKIYPYIKEQTYDKAAALAGYRHSASSLTKDEIENRPLKDTLQLLKKNSLRNPIVEKILNQMINVINTLIETNSEKDKDGNITKYFKFDEIRIELARELKKNAKERAEMSTNINAAKLQHEKIITILKNEFDVKNPTRNDIIRYKLYEELKNNGYKDLYTDKYIPKEILFSKQVDIEHIIPRAKLFDDSFSNKTIIYRDENIKKGKKGNKTGYDYIEEEYGEKAATEYKARIENLYQLGLKSKEEGISVAKYKKLLKREAEIGDGFIERDLRDSQYIAKKAKNILYSITRNVVSTSGSITDKLREDWDLINIMQELNFDKYKKLGLTEMVEKKDGNFKERIIDWSKRNDHRHHAMDALTVAFTKHSHIQYLNFLNARYNETHKEHKNIKGIEDLETHIKIDDEGNKKRVFNLPIPNFREQAKEHLENILVSFKAKNKVATKNKNKIKGKEKPQISLTPRGQLHKETIYGKYHYYENKEEKISAKFDEATILKVSNPTYRDLLLKRLIENNNDPKKAFAGKNSIDKNPIYVDINKTQKVPDKVNLTWLEEDYSIRKDITPDNFKDIKTIDKILDAKIKQLLLRRLKEFNNDPKKAFSDLDKNPIWFNKEKGISIKRVTISGIKNAEALHYQKDHLGNFILDNEDKKIPVDFVSTGNNHHVAIYQDAKGNLQERVVSLFDAVKLMNIGLPVIDKEYNQGIGWQFLFTMKQNEFFIFPNEKTGFNPTEIDILNPHNNKLISPNLYRIQKLSTGDYWFRHHLETTVDTKSELKDITYKRLGLNGIKDIVKVRINHIGEIVKIGE